MQYTELGKTGLKVSRLGFGCMRLPMKSAKEVDRELAIPMLHRAVELGITYFDTAVGYCAGDSQRALGEAMEGMRDQIILSTKNHHYNKEDKKGWWKNLEDSLERLRTDHLDIYNFHGLNYERYQSALDGEDGLYKEMLKAKEQGMVRHICHSFHGSLESLKHCIDTGLFESITVQYNLLDQRLEEGIAYASEHGMGVVIMGPVGGGRLGYPSGTAQEIAREVKSTPELALRFVLSNRNVNVALSGMSTMQQLEENVETVSASGSLSVEDHARIEAAVQERKTLAGLYCTGCNYCMPCPDGVDIPANFEILNLDRVFGLTDHARSRYVALGGKAALCRQCGKCVELCPQDLDIPRRLGEAVALLDKRSGSVSGWAEYDKATRDEDGSMKISMRYHVKNFSETDYDRVKVKLHAHQEEQITPSSFEFTKVKGYARRHKNLEIGLDRPVEAMSIDSLISFEGSHTFEHIYLVAASAARVDKYPRKDLGAPGPLLHVPGAVHPAHAATGDAASAIAHHSFDFSVGYDESKLHVWVDAEDDLLQPFREPPGWDMRIDHVRIFLDGREQDRLGLGSNADGVVHVSISPAADPDAEPFVRSSKEIDTSVRLIRTELGYRFVCSIPWKGFVVRDGIPPVVGFDLALASHDAEANRLVRLTWSGREGQERDTATFGRLFIV